MLTGVWTHGDFCYFNSKTGGVIMLGRRSALIVYYNSITVVFMTTVIWLCL